MASLIIPAHCTDMDAMLQFTRAAREKLRRLHNATGLLTHGATPQLSRDQWLEWVRTVFKPRSHAITNTELALRAEAGIIDTSAGAKPGELSDYQKADLATMELADDDVQFDAVDLENGFIGIEASAALPDPTEDFSTYTETDPGNDLTVTASKIDADALPDTVDTYVYDDKGVDYFGATFEHLVKFTLISATVDPGEYWYVSVWGVSNTVDDAKGWDTNNNEAVHSYLKTAGNSANTLYLKDEETASSDAWVEVGDIAGTPYYPAIERTGETAVEERLYDDAPRTSLVDTLAITITSGQRYRYVFGIVSHNIGDGYFGSIDVEDLDLQGSSAPHPALFMGASF